jgi:hypothetical protein
LVHRPYEGSLQCVQRVHFARNRSQQGAVAVIVAAMLILILGVCGMAIDLGFIYNRRVELQNLANATALAAAAQLDGSTNGVNRALDRAAAVAVTFKYAYGKSLTWSDSAIQFGMSPSETGEWIASDIARTTPDNLLFVRVDTLALDSSIGIVQTFFMDAIGASRTSILQGNAIAGRKGVKVTPLAICAISSAAAAGRSTGAGTELVEFGFRRGISYDLMRLNPNGTQPEHFMVNPFVPPGAAGPAMVASTESVAPHVCAGTMPMPRVTGGTIAVTRPFPIGSLFGQLNSRFDQFSGTDCNRVNAPPDTNIKVFDYTKIGWMSNPPLGQGAASLEADGKLLTVADPSPAPSTNKAGSYGPLWSFAKAVPFSAYVAGAREPAGGYAAFSSSQWTSLYDPGQPSANNYPTIVPYLSTLGANYLAPSTTVRGQANRRVLNIPLLACPVVAGSDSATALAVGKFFMTVPATASNLFAEFGGIVSDQALGTSTGLY